MKRRSRTNKRHAEDLAFRAEYMRGRYYDELLRYFPVCGLGKVKVPGHDKPLTMHGEDAFEVHHAFGGYMGRWDRPWNLVAVCRPVHLWCERYKVDGRVLAVRLKLDQGLWDDADAFDCLGFSPLGKLQVWTCLFPWAERIRQEIVRGKE